MSQKNIENSFVFLKTGKNLRNKILNTVYKDQKNPLNKTLPKISAERNF